jgi:hypothetical protein
MRTFTVSCTGECEDELVVTVTYYAAAEPMTRDYPGCPAEMEFEFKCETCGVTEETCGLETYVRVEEMVEEQMYDWARDAAEAAAEDRYDDWKDSHMFGEDY